MILSQISTLLEWSIVVLGGLTNQRTFMELPMGLQYCLSLHLQIVGGELEH